MALLRVSELRTEFATHAGAVRAVDGVSFELNAGEVLGLVGESGSGKSVTALSILGLLPSSGRVVGGEALFDGVDLLQLPDRSMRRRYLGSQIGIIFQNPMSSLNPVFPVGRQISETLRRHKGMSKAVAYRRSIELLDMVGISNASRRVDDYPHQLSGGMRQRIMIAMAIACTPRLLVADEITTALDVTVQAQILKLLKELIEHLGAALLLITHDLGVVASMTGRVHVMYAGQVVEKAQTRDLFADPKMPYTWGLLHSVLDLDSSDKGRLNVIAGVAPNLIDPPSGCRFSSRCAYRLDICDGAAPGLDAVDEVDQVGVEQHQVRVGGDAARHEARCWGTGDAVDGGWLRGIDWRRPVVDAPPQLLDESGQL